MNLSLGQSLGHLVGDVYPAYTSFKSLKSGDPTRIRQMLTYWVTKAFFNGLEYISPLSSLVPFYNYLRIGVLVWLQNDGATRVYHSVIEPMLNRNERDIDNFVIQGQNAASETLERSTPRVQQFLVRLRELVTLVVFNLNPSLTDQ